MSDPTGFTTGKELVKRDRLIREEEPEEMTDEAAGAFLELWEDRNGSLVWAFSLMDSYRDHVAKNSIHIQLSDEEAGWLQRHYTAEVADD